MQKKWTRQSSMPGGRPHVGGRRYRLCWGAGRGSGPADCGALWQGGQRRQRRALQRHPADQRSPPQALARVARVARPKVHAQRSACRSRGSGWMSSWVASWRCIEPQQRTAGLCSCPRTAEREELANAAGADAGHEAVPGRGRWVQGQRQGEVSKAGRRVGMWCAPQHTCRPLESAPTTPAACASHPAQRLDVGLEAVAAHVAHRHHVLAAWGGVCEARFGRGGWVVGPSRGNPPRAPAATASNARHPADAAAGPEPTRPPRFAAYTARAQRIWRVPDHRHSAGVLLDGLGTAAGHSVQDARQQHLRRKRRMSEPARMRVRRPSGGQHASAPAQHDAPPAQRVPAEGVPAGHVHRALDRLVLGEPA